MRKDEKNDDSDNGQSSVFTPDPNHEPRKADPYYRVAAAVFAICFTAFLSYFLASNNKITAQEATTISQTQAKLVIAEELKAINKNLLQISESVAGLSAKLNHYSPNTRMRN